MPPLPSSSITSNRPAKVVPDWSSVTIVATVCVGGAERSGAGGVSIWGSGEAHFPQNFVSAGFSCAHLGHFIPGLRYRTAAP